MWKKLIEQDIEEMKRLRAEGLTYRAIADRFGTAISTVQYHTGDSYKQSVKLRAKKWNKKNYKKERIRHRNWQKNNKDKYFKSVCLGTIRYNFKRGYIVEDDIERVLTEFQPISEPQPRGVISWVQEQFHKLF